MHFLEGTQAFEDSRQLQAVFHRHFQVHVTELVVLVLGTDLLDICVQAVDASSQHGNHATPVFDLNTKGRGKLSLDLVIPAQRYQPVGIVAKFGEVVAVFPVYHHAALCAEIACHGIPRDRVTTFCVADHEALGPSNRYRLCAEATFAIGRLVPLTQ